MCQAPKAMVWMQLLNSSSFPAQLGPHVGTGTGRCGLQQQNWGQDEATGEHGWLLGGTLLCSVCVRMGLLLHRAQLCLPGH